MKSFFKEIFLCIWSLIKEIITEGIYAIKQFFILLIIIFVPFLLAFGISTVFDFPLWLTIMIGIIILILFICLYAVIYGNIKKPFCKVPVVAKIVDTMTLRHVSDDAPYYETQWYILVLEYKYKNKIYKKKIEVSDGNLRVVGAEVNIMVCDKFPKIIYLVKEEKTEVDREIEKLGFADWYMYNRLQEDLKEKIIRSSKRYIKENTTLIIFNLVFLAVCVALAYIFARKESDFETMFIGYLGFSFALFILVFFITLIIHTIIRTKSPYVIYTKWIRENSIYEIDSEESEQKYIQKLRKKL